MRLLLSLVAAIRTNKLTHMQRPDIAGLRLRHLGVKLRAIRQSRIVATATTVASTPQSQCYVPFSGCENTAVVMEV
jgi:hypothetical protein